MQNFAGEHGITAGIGTTKLDQINNAWERVINADVRCRLVIAMEQMGAAA